MNKIVHVLKCFADGEMQAATAYNLHRPKLGLNTKTTIASSLPDNFPTFQSSWRKAPKPPKQAESAQEADQTSANAHTLHRSREQHVVLPGHLGIAEGAKLRLATELEVKFNCFKVVPWEGGV